MSAGRPAARRSSSISDGLIVRGIEDRLEPTRGELLNLLCREIDAVSFGDPRTDLAHDLLDVELIAIAGPVVAVLRRPAIAAATVRATPAAMIVRSARMLLIVIRWHRPSALLRRALRDDGRRPRPLFRANQVRRTAGESVREPTRSYTLADDWKLRMASASLSWVSNTVSSLVIASRSVIRLVRLRSFRLPP